MLVLLPTLLLFLHGTAAGSNPFQTAPYFDGEYVVVEAEDFDTSAAPSWSPAKWGIDPSYYCGAVMNVFMSRRAYLTAPAAATDIAPASATIIVPKAGKWQLMARYEALNRFDSNFRVTLSQKGVKKMDTVYGLLTNLKVWAYSSPSRHYEGLNGSICGPGLNAMCKCVPIPTTARIPGWMAGCGRELT
jgi:hypothetical protein